MVVPSEHQEHVDSHTPSAAQDVPDVKDTNSVSEQTKFYEVERILCRRYRFRFRFRFRFFIGLYMTYIKMLLPLAFYITVIESNTFHKLQIYVRYAIPVN